MANYEHTRGTYRFPDTLLRKTSIYFTDKHFLLRIGDVIGESYYIISKKGAFCTIDHITVDGKKRGTETNGIAFYDKDKKVLVLYMNINPGRPRPTRIPDEAEEERDLIKLKKLEE